MSSRLTRRGLGWLVLVLVLGVNLMVGFRLYSKEAPPPERESPYDTMALFTKVLEQVRENYVDVEKTDYKDLIYGALRGMLSSLDPHSQFMDPEVFKEMKDDTAGQFGGLGIVISLRDGVLTIVAPMEDTPGFRAGLMAGDKIIEIDGESTEGLSLHQAVKRLRGKPGTKVTIKILRPKTQEVRTVEIVRAEIKVPSVKDADILEDGIGYLRITQFNEPTARALQKAVDGLLEKGMRALIVDLRNNPGGLLSAAVDVSQKFLPRGSVIVSIKGRKARQQQTFRARGRRHYVDFPMAVLINGGSASASEIFSGAMQDHRRAIIIGEKSFGKGSVQSVLPEEDGSAIRLTTAYYYTPDHRLIQDKGIIPDIVVPMSAEDWRKVLIKRSRPKNAPPEEGEEELEEVADVQLERAVDVLKGVIIFEKHAGSVKGTTFKSAAGG